jgi:hypothetical protein
VVAAAKSDGDICCDEGVVVDSAFRDELKVVDEEGGFRGEKLAGYDAGTGSD